MLYLALLQSMEYKYCERQLSQFIRVSGLQTLTQKFGLCLHLEMVDSSFAFPTNYKPHQNIYRIAGNIGGH